MILPLGRNQKSTTNGGNICVVHPIAGANNPFLDKIYVPDSHATSAIRHRMQAPWFLARRKQRHIQTTIYCGILLMKMLDVGCFPLTGFPPSYKTLLTKGLSKKGIDPLN
jgi:hypothetical protein